MPAYNDKFYLNVKDIDIIENALRKRMQDFSISAKFAKESGSWPTKKDSSDLADVVDLLAKIHHQKQWYDSKDGIPRG